MRKKEKLEKLHKEHKVSVCDFAIKEFNKSKRSLKFVEELNTNSSKRGGRGGGKPVKNPPVTPPSVVTTGCIFLQFEGATVINTTWNILAPEIYCTYSGLSEDEKLVIINSVKEDYSIFNVVITTDENVFNSFPTTKRMKCIITESYEWYGNGAGGIALINTFTNTTEEPCFIFSSLLGYNIKYIREAVSHEIGHTLGLYHQSKYDESGNYVSEYNYGTPEVAPIMGIAYYSIVGKWWVGINPYNQPQDDIQKISQILSLK